MEVPKIKGREAGISVEAMGIKSDQAVLYTKCPLLPYPPTPKCTPAMSLMCERMKPGSKLVICWEFCQRADWFLLVFPSHVCTCRAETAMVTSSSVNLSLLASLVKTYVSGWRE